MAALTGHRNTRRFGTGSTPDLSFATAASTTTYKGGLVGVNSSGYAVSASSSAALKIAGIDKYGTDNSSGSAGDKRTTVEQGCFHFQNSSGADAIAADDFGKPCYVVDDQTVALTQGEGSTLRPLAGIIVGYDSTYGPAVFCGAVNLGATVQKIEQIIEHSDLTAAATSEAIALGTLPANSFVLGHEIYIETLFSGGSVSAITLDIGGTDADAIVDGHDVFTGAATGRLTGSTLGVHNAGYFGAEAMVATFVATGDNVVNLTAGKLTVTIPYLVL
jgi:hypothetical protein